MENHECMLKRRSIRQFLSKEVNDAQIKKMLEAAMAAPSAINRQPWEFYVIKNKQIQSKIRQIATYYNYNSTLLIVVAGNENYFISNAKDFWIEDCSAATENILLAATESGLGSVWCGIYPKQDRIDAVAKILNTPKNIIPFALIHIGYPNEVKEKRTQYDLEKIHQI